MNDSRARAIKLNMLAGWAAEIFAFISGLILPRLMLTHFGSSTNGLVNSIGQFLSFSVVFRAGLGGVTRAALYKPLAEKNKKEVSSIMVATRSYMWKVSAFVALYTFAIAIIYPFLADSEFSWDFMFTMTLIIGTGILADSLFGIKAKILLQADQKYYVPTLCSLASHICSFIISVILIKYGCSIIVVKLGAASVAFLNPLLLSIYVRKHYKLDMKVAPNNMAISQRWDAFAQQMAVVVNNSVDLVILTLFVNLREISVYTVHNMIVINIRKIVESCVTGINSMFGDMIAKKEDETLRKTFLFIEWAFFAVCTILFSVTAIMLVPFIKLYTANIYDVNYIRPLFAFVITLAALMGCMKIPYQMVVEAAGRFKQTRNGAIFEVVINIAASLVLLYFFGIVGVILGTILAAIIRTMQYSFQAFKYILNIPLLHIMRNYVVYIFVFIGMCAVATMINTSSITGWIGWVIYACITTFFVTIIVAIISLVNNTEQFKYLIRKILKKENKKRI